MKSLGRASTTIVLGRDLYRRLSAHSPSAGGLSTAAVSERILLKCHFEAAAQAGGGLAFNLKSLLCPACATTPHPPPPPPPHHTHAAHTLLHPPFHRSAPCPRHVSLLGPCTIHRSGWSHSGWALSSRRWGGGQCTTGHYGDCGITGTPYANGKRKKDQERNQSQPCGAFRFFARPAFKLGLACQCFVLKCCSDHFARFQVCLAQTLSQAPFLRDNKFILGNARSGPQCLLLATRDAMAPADREAYTVARIRDVVSHHMVSDSRTSCHLP